MFARIFVRREECGGFCGYFYGRNIREIFLEWSRYVSELCMRHHKSLCVVVVMRQPWLTHIHTQTHSQLLLGYIYTVGALRIFSRGGQIHRCSHDFLCAVEFFPQKS